MIIDGFIESFEDLRESSVKSAFRDEVNPIDGVVYPLICRDLPIHIEKEICSNLDVFLGRPIVDYIMFMRRSPIGTKCPHQVHSDASMGLYSLMLYINDCGDKAGTSLVSHKKTGIAFNPEEQEFVDIIEKDQNNEDAWGISEMIDMKPNRAFIFNSSKLHRAEPLGGFGQGEDSRVVLTCFFS